MIVYFLRHANAGQRLASPKKDEKRGLDKEGIEQCGYVGRALASFDVQVDAIISSPLKRSTQTAALVGNEIGHEAKLQIDPALRPQASFTEFRKLLDKYARLEAIMVVGHNPTAHALSQGLIRASDKKGHSLAVRAGFPTCALGVYSFKVETWSEVEGHGAKLVALLTPPFGGEE